ncbi:MAG: hypothetical protein JSW59_12365 [Phycisphaerales bacterium]|nr:MAG: hypothetical protein JSW59_12365 [Phycisphaerales bacterium]
MNKEETTYGLSREKLVRILRIGSMKVDRQHVSSVQQDTADLLRQQLAQPFPSGSTLDSQAPGLSEVPCHPAALMRLETVGELLWNRGTPTSLLKRLRKLGKRLFSEGKTTSQRDAGLTIYYGAIANALISHDVRITRLPYLELRRSFGQLVDKEWIPPRLQNLFREAHEYCRAKTAMSANPET